MKAMRYKIVLLSLLSLPAMLLVAIGGRRRLLRLGARRALLPDQAWGHSSQPSRARPRPAARPAVTCSPAHSARRPRHICPPARH